MRTLSVFVLFFTLNNLLAQSNDLQVISTSGKSFTYENYIVEYTLGELAIDNIVNGIILTQGFHQGKLAIQTEIKEIDFKINLFPNPAHTHFKVEFNSPKTVDIILTDIKGRIIMREKIVNQTSKSYDVSNLAQGIYIFTVIDSTNKQATYKIKKIR
ncbi:MAG: T9SS type A sorting domain-containing protein [Flavobacteriales bacterium]|nr:T9SS type A sorting domain-containing protein [Flavobacteriales bacterium]